MLTSPAKGRSAISHCFKSTIVVGSQPPLFQIHYRGRQSAARQLAVWQSAKAISHYFKSTINGRRIVA
jgi:hypothetical protein